MVSTELFHRLPLFSGLDDDDLESLISVTTRRSFPKDGVVFFEHDLGDSLFMIVSGRVKVTILLDEGHEIILAVLSGDEFCGEMGLLDNDPRSATAITMQDTEMVVLHQGEFLSIVENRSRVAINLLDVLSSRLRKANQQIGKLALHDVYGRVAFRRATHHEVANMIGATRETLSLMISDLHGQGFIEISEKDVIIQDALAREFAGT